MKEEIEEIIEKIGYTPGVIGIVICTSTGHLIRDLFSANEREEAFRYAKFGIELVKKAVQLEPVFDRCSLTTNSSSKVVDSEVQDGKESLDSSLENRVSSLRVRTQTNEIIIRRLNHLLMVVVQELHF